ncbi:MAG: hypothetical protein KF773_05825 [Deltaproteobacteria bacterium]|nr:hypothetical protein [Deltaproteobacteria bacterium]
MRRPLLLALLVLALGACDRSKGPDPGENKQPTPPGSGSQAAAKTPEPAAFDGVEIFLDDRPVAKVKKEDLAKWPHLTTLLPEDARRLGTWNTLSIRGKDKAELTRPSATYPDKVAALYLDKSGAPTFGMFDAVELAKKGEPAMRADAVTEIRLVLSKEGRGGDHQGGAGGVDDPSKLVVTIKQGKQPAIEFSGEKLLALPREAQPGRDDTKGWRLSALLEAAGVKKWDKLVLGDASGTTIVLDKADFDDKTVIPFIKLNKSNSLRLRVVKKVGDGWQNGADLRALASITVE